MANKLIAQMCLPQSMSNIFSARNILTAKDALSLPEFDLMELLDVGLEQVRHSVAQISEVACPPYQTALQLMESRVRNEESAGHLPTTLKGLDDALCGGIPFGCLTELVGPAGIGKTQFCLKLAVIAALPKHVGGLDGWVYYIDTESKFSSRRMIEIGLRSFPHIFHSEAIAKEIAGRIVILRPTTLAEFTERSCMWLWLRELKFLKRWRKNCREFDITCKCMVVVVCSLDRIKLLLLQHEVKLLIIDSMAALVSSEYEISRWKPRQQSWASSISYLKSLAELSHIPVVVTNQVKCQNTSEPFSYNFEGHKENPTGSLERVSSELIAALGVQWFHSVTLRLILESHSGNRFIKVAKCPLSPPLAFPFCIKSSGVSLLTDEGIVILGSEINTIHSEGNNLLYVGNIQEPILDES